MNGTNKYRVHLPEPRLEDLNKEQLIEVIRRYCFRPTAWQIARVVWDLGIEQVHEWMSKNMAAGKALTGPGLRKQFLQNCHDWDQIMEVDQQVNAYHDRWLMDTKVTDQFDKTDWERRQQEAKEKALRSEIAGEG